MPSPRNLVPIEITFDGPYNPSAPALSPGALQRSIRRGSNVWRRKGGKVRVARGLLETSSQNVGARLFTANTQRASIAGALVGNRLPFAGFLRYDNAVLLYLSENTGAQVYLDEAAVSGLTTSSTAGRLRVAVPDGVGGYGVVDAGFDAPSIESDEIGVSTDVAPLTNAVPTIPMAGAIGVALARWRTKTDAVGPPSTTFYVDVPQSAAALINLTNSGLPALSSGQDGWVFCGTRWNDRSGELRVVRFFRAQPRGTFSAENGVDTITGVDTFWLEDLRVGDLIVIDITIYAITEIPSNTSATLSIPYVGGTGSGKTMTMRSPAGAWYDSELGALVQRDIIRPPRAAGVLQYAGRVLVWGCFGESESSPTGPVILIMSEDNPEHCLIRGIRTTSGGDLLNVLGGDGPLYLMTTLGLEVVSFTGDPGKPYIPRVIAEPGFKAATNGLLFGDYFYGFNGRPFRTRAEQNIDFEFAAPVEDDMEGWDAERVVIAADPVNQAVLYAYDDLSETKVVPFMAQQEQWGPPLYFSERFLDSAVVNNALYLTALSGGNIRVHQWEGGSEIGGERFISSQFYDENAMLRSRLKNAMATGKVGSISIYVVEPGAEPPDVSDLGAAAVTFTQSDLAASEPEEWTNLEGRAYAFRADFASNDGYLDKIVARGLPRTERR